MLGFFKRAWSKLKSVLKRTHVSKTGNSSGSPLPKDVPKPQSPTPQSNASNAGEEAPSQKAAELGRATYDGSEATGSLQSHTPQPSANEYKGSERAVELGRMVYDGLNLIVKSLHDCSDMFGPLKTATGVFLAITEVVNRVSANKKELNELELRLKSILSIVETYKELGVYVNSSPELKNSATNIHQKYENEEKTVMEMKNHSSLARTATSTTDADKIAKAFRNMNILGEMFQMDTQANIAGNVAEIIRLLRTGTHIQILEDLVAWASHEQTPKVFWMVRMAGTGKSTIAQTFCEILNEKNMLGASFFCSQTSDNTNNARLIIPAIAHSLSSASPTIRSHVIKAIGDDPALAEPTYNNMKVQFTKLIAQPTRMAIGEADKWYKVIVIDGVDECRDLHLVSSLIRLLLVSATQIPFRIFIASLDEYLIRQAFNTYPAEELCLHEFDTKVVKEDIVIYVEASLSGYSGDLL
ncbi:hypothetical protein DFH07DRAFT_776523 [Mycena maculata]|uniref:Nephrocystin 3-like N-terminal domain-containing protein n=1 Tax=Mycena maculata TaxID=230809 RepID=A0AAD7IM22_9AGAR|nr:hypothetical protein DFH07DRAFT_776523 [Mycena maculata]